MPQKHSEIVVHFKQQAHNIFSESYTDLPSNKLTIRLQPDEGVELEMMNKIPGIASQMQIHENKLDLSFSQAYDNQRVVDAYERLILKLLMAISHYLLVVMRLKPLGNGLIVLLPPGKQLMKHLNLMLQVHGDRFHLFL